jgi:hypothetical protein
MAEEDILYGQSATQPVEIESVQVSIVDERDPQSRTTIELKGGCKLDDMLPIQVLQVLMATTVITIVEARKGRDCGDARDRTA